MKCLATNALASELDARSLKSFVMMLLVLSGLRLLKFLNFGSSRENVRNQTDPTAVQHRKLKKLVKERKITIRILLNMLLLLLPREPWLHRLRMLLDLLSHN